MFFSYQKAIQSQVEPAIYARGIRDFLEGKVSKKSDLTLDYWQEYEVVGRMENTIKIPLLHLALGREKFDMAGKALLEVATCTCENFLQRGYCRHLVAVCSYLDQNLGLNEPVTMQMQKKLSNSVLENIFAVENQKVFREFENEMEAFLVRKSKNTSWVTKLSESISANPNEYRPSLTSFELTIHDYLKNYDYQKRFVEIAPQFLMLGKKIWWDFFSIFFVDLNLILFYDLLAQIWELQELKLCYEYEKEVIEFVKNIDETTKEEVINRLQNKFRLNQQIWINFAINSQYLLWLDKNLDYLDPFSLLKLVETIPQFSDQVEIILWQKIKVWSDFLETNENDEYKEIETVFNRWEEVIGHTELYERSLEYIKTSHPKKKKLIKSIQ